MLIMSTSVLFSVDYTESDYHLSPLHSGQKSLHSYFNSLGIENVYQSTVCRENCTGDHCCYPVIKNGKNHVLYSYGSDDSVSTVASGRYKSGAYLLYEHSYRSGKKSYTDRYLIDANGKRYDVPRFNSANALSAIVSKKRDVMQVFEDGIYRNDTLIVSASGLERAQIRSNPRGDMAVVAVNDVGAVLVSNMKEFISANILLAKGGDRDGILSVYPKNSEQVYLAVYNNVNVYNKGLMGAVIDFKGGQSHSGWLCNSERENIGFDPQLYVNGDEVIISSYNSSTKEHVSQTVTLTQFNSIDLSAPKHTKGFENEPFLGFIVGAKLSQLSWIASSKVEPESTTYASVDYDIGDSLYKSIFFEGRISNVNLGVSYLKGEAQKKGGLTAKASEALNFLVDFNQLISPSTSLRVMLTDAEINGLATFNTDYNGLSLTPNGTQEAFSSKLTRFSVLAMMERGWYFGGEYANYITPSAVGFSNSSKNIDTVALDKEFEIQTYEFVFGYDEISYAKRYETDLARFYVQAMGGIGAAVYSLSSQTRSAVESSTAKSIKNSTYSIALDGSVDVVWM